MIKLTRVLMAPIGIATLFGASLALGASVTGQINGYGCAHEGHSCPTESSDPHLALEPDFVLLKADGDYLFMSNVPRDVKVRHALEQVTVNGDVNEKLNNIDVDEFKVGDKLVWSKAMHYEAVRRFKYFSGESKGQ